MAAVGAAEMSVISEKLNFGPQRNSPVNNKNSYVLSFAYNKCLRFDSDQRKLCRIIFVGNLI